MSEINIERSHNLSLENSRKLLIDFAEKLKEQYKGSYTETDEGMTFKAPGVEGQVILTDTSISVKAKLGLLLRAFKSKFETEINEGIDNAINMFASEESNIKVVSEDTSISESSVKEKKSRSKNKKV